MDSITEISSFALFVFTFVAALVVLAWNQR